MLHTSEYQNSLITQYKKSKQSMHMRLTLQANHRRGNDYIINILQQFIAHNAYFLYYIDDDYTISRRASITLALDVDEARPPKGIRFQAKARADGIDVIIDANHILYDGRSMICLVNGMIESMNRGLPVILEDMSETFYERALKHNAMHMPSNERTATLVARQATTKKSGTGRIEKMVDPLRFAQMKRWAIAHKQSVPLLLVGALGRVFKHDFVAGHVQIGTVVDMRSRPSERTKLGLGINTIPVTMPVDEDTVEGYFTALKKQYLASLHNMYVPQHARGYKPELLFSYQETQLSRLEEGRVAIDWQPIEQSSIPIAFTFFAHETEGEIYLEYDERMYTAEMMARKIERLFVLLEQLTTQQIDTLPRHVLAPEDLALHATLKGRKQQLENTSAYDVIRRMWEQAPTQKTMVIYKDKKYTYTVLMQEMNFLADLLAAKNIQPGDFVGIQTDDPLHHLVAILASWQLGATFVPLDLSLPEARIAYIKEQCQLSLIIDETLWTATDREGREVNAKKRARTRGANAYAYVIFTSGTSGTPKGCLQTHRNLLNIAGDNTMQLDTSSVFLQAMKTTFDVSLMGIVALMAGATIVLQDENEISNPSKTMDMIKRYHVSALNTTTALFETWVPTYLDTLRRVDSLMVGGEALKRSTVESVFDQLQGRLINGYGPTETTIYAVVHRIDTLPEESVPIGRPIANTDLRILNEDQADVGIGEIGELCIAGEGVGAGYVGDRPTTDEKFKVIAGRRTYMTGDLCYVNAAGNIIFYGRKDEQVKVNGFRIDPLEVVRYIEQVESVRQAIVFKQDHRLVCAYIKEDGQPVFELRKMQDYLRQYLPKYMIPSTFVALEALALTPNGKIDYDKIRSAVQVQLTEATVTTYDLQTLASNERQIVASWEKVLHALPLTKEMTLAEAGATSLELISLYTELDQAFVEELIFEDFDATWTLARLARQFITVRETADANIEAVGADVALMELTDTQRNIFLAQAKDKASTKYNVPVLIQLKAIDVAKFKLAAEQLTEELQDLHVNFTVDDEGMHVRRNEGPFAALTYREIEQLDDAIAAIQPFDLAADELIRLFFFDCAGAHYFLLDSHHIIMDGVSMNGILKRLDELYHATTYTPQQTPSFMRYVAFEKRQKENDKSVAFWQEQLNAGEKYTLLSDAKPKDGHNEYKLIRKTFPHLLSQLKRKGLDPNTYILMALGLLIARHSDAKRQFVGLTMSGRIRGEFAATRGLLINTIPLVYDYASLTGKSFQAIYLKINNEIKLAAIHQFVDFNELMRTKKLVEDNEVFALLVNIREAFAPRQLGTFVHADAVIEPKYPLNLEFVKQTDALELIYEYDGARFAAAEVEAQFVELADIIERLHEHETDNNIYQRMLETYEMNKKATRAKRNVEHKSVGAAFYEHVAATPQAIALETVDEQITYEQLYNMSAHLARRLRVEHGLELGDRVGLSFTKTPEMIVAMLALAMCGATYVPINLAFPAQLKADMFRLTGTKFVIGNTTDTFVDLCLQRRELQSFKLDEKEAVAADASLPLYILFTSGTTGTPKGIEVTHCNVTNLVRSNFEPQSKTKSILFSDYSFDGSVYDIYITLLNGGTLFLTDHANIINPDILCALIAQYSIQTCFMPAAYFHALTDRHYEQLQGMHALLVGGEELAGPHIERAFKHLAGKIWNGYGPTETTVFATTHQITQQNIDERLIPLGRPLHGVEVTIVDEKGYPLPPYAIGELLITGTGVSHGYINADNYAFGKNGAVYATGDVGYSDHLGRIIYRGRKQETQIKYRGYRIELRAIEANIIASELVDQVCVLFDDDKQKLAMFLVSEDASFDVQRLMTYLRAHVPAYMIPTFYRVLTSLPLNKNGKIDRQALKPYTLDTIHDELAQTEQTHLPQDELTERLAGIWRNVLGVETIHMRSHFFELGGYSLQAMKIVSSLKMAGIELTIQDVSDYPIFSDFCARVKHVYSKQMIENQKDEFYALSDTVEIKTVKQSKSKVQVFVLPTYMLNFAYYMIFEVMTKKYPSYIEWNICNFATEKNFIEKYTARINDIIKPNKKILLLGYSFGGCFAYEVANVLINKYHRRIDGLIVLDSYFKTTHDTGLEFFMDDLSRQDMFHEKLIEFFPAYGELAPDLQDDVEQTFLGFMRNTVTLQNKKYNLDTTLHFLEAAFQEHGLKDTRNEWFDGCFARTKTYVAHGQHNDMLNEENVDQNFNIIEKIIEKEVKK